MKRPVLWLIFLSFFALGSTAPPSAAKVKARIKGLRLAVDEESLGISFFVENCFSPRIERMIQKGVPATLTFIVRLHRSKKLWKDRRILSLKVKRRIHYDNIKKVYQVFLHETSPPVVFTEFWEAKASVGRVEDLWVTPWRPLREHTTYYVRVKAELEPMGPPFGLGDLLFFLPSGKIETDWFVQAFRVGSFVVPRQTGGTP
jgi:hypothetical protein